MPHKRLTYGQKGLAEIKAFLVENRRPGYTLSFYDILAEQTAEIDCSFEEMFPIICAVVDTEHDYPSWIGMNENTDSYVVGLKFTRGCLETPAIYKAEDGKLRKVFPKAEE